MKKLIFIAGALMLVGAGCFPKCIKSHEATRHVEAQPIYSYHKIGKTSVRYQSGTRPAHDETYTACDEYEK